MTKFFSFCIFVLFGAAFADEDDNVQLIQTRILQKGPASETVFRATGYDLSTSDGQRDCIMTMLDGVSSGWASWDCEGTGNFKAAAAPLYCNDAISGGGVSTCCAGRGCAGATPTPHTTQRPPFDLSTSDGQRDCLIQLLDGGLSTSGWQSWDCQGTGNHKGAAAPRYCNDPISGGGVSTCCAGRGCAGATTTTPPTPTATTTTAEVPDVSVCPGTDSPGGDTDVTDADCLDAERGFGPDFSCANTEMYCSSDSGDGLTVGACCPTKCKQEFEKKKKNSNAETQGKNEAERKGKRASNEGTRKKNEKDRKTKRKDTEWNTKRDAKEIENKNAEEERKNKRGWEEGQRKSERGWKNNRRDRRAAANKREVARKAKNGASESSKKNQQAEEQQKKRAAHKIKKEKRIKKNSR